MTTAAEARRSKKAREGRRAQDRRRRERLRGKTKQLHSWLIEQLGGRCARCGDTGVGSPLTVEHVEGITWRRRKLNPYKRVQRYVAEHKQGVRLECLCLSCNSAGGTAHHGKVYVDELEPFDADVTPEVDGDAGEPPLDEVPF